MDNESLNSELRIDDFFEKNSDKQTDVDICLTVTGGALIVAGAPIRTNKVIVSNGYFPLTTNEIFPLYMSVFTRHRIAYIMSE